MAHQVVPVFRVSVPGASRCAFVLSQVGKKPVPLAIAIKIPFSRIILLGIADAMVLHGIFQLCTSRLSIRRGLNRDVIVGTGSDKKNQ